MQVSQLPAVVKREIANAKLPVLFEDAVKALAACLTLDEAKYWDNKADALAAWAKIYRDGKIERDARALKLLAYRRMGELAEELRPSNIRVRVPEKGTFGTRPNGGRSLLLESGLTSTQATQASHIRRLPKEAFNDMVNAKRPPSVYTAFKTTMRGSESWKTFVNNTRSPFNTKSFARQHSAHDLAVGMTLEEADKARKIALELIDWLDEFEQHLPKGKAAAT